jgi:hypothetical protein
MSVPSPSCAVLPTPLHPTDTLPLPLSQGIVHVPLCRARFTAYSGQDSAHTFGGKDLLLVDGLPQFAEVAINRALPTAAPRSTRNPARRR